MANQKLLNTSNTSKRNGRKGSLKPTEITVSHTRYREESKSKYKKEKHAAHILGKKIVCHIQNSIPGPKPIDSLKVAANSSDNLKMIKAEINQKEHEKTDNQILKIWDEIEEYGETEKSLNGTQAKRARMQCKIIQKSPDFSKKFKETAREKYKQIPATYQEEASSHQKPTYSSSKKGGKHHINSNQYKTFSSSHSKATHSSSSLYSNSSSLSKPSSSLYRGSKGGTYYINSNGNKTYIASSEYSPSHSKQIYCSSPSYPSSSSYYSSRGSANGRALHTGSRGGKYYTNSSGNKTYVLSPTKPVTKPSPSYSSSPSYSTSYTSSTTSSSPSYYSSSGSANGSVLHTGSRGGTYYINSNGNKSYV